MNSTFKCPFKDKERGEMCDKDKCALWYEGGCAFVHIARELGILNEAARSGQAIKF